MTNDQKPDSDYTSFELPELNNDWRYGAPGFGVWSHSIDDAAIRIADDLYSSGSLGPGPSIAPHLESAELLKALTPYAPRYAESLCLFIENGWLKAQRVVRTLQGRLSTSQTFIDHDELIKWYELVDLVPGDGISELQDHLSGIGDDALNYVCERIAKPERNLTLPPALAAFLAKRGPFDTNDTQLAQDAIRGLVAENTVLFERLTQAQATIPKSHARKWPLIAGALLNLLITPRRNQTTIKSELEELGIRGLGTRTLDDAFAEANKEFKDRTKSK